MKILFVIHECNSAYNVFPYGIGYLAAVLRGAGHTVTIFDQATAHYSDEELYSHIKDDKSYGFIGLGFQAAYFHIAQKTCEAIKAACGPIPIVLGGSAPSASPVYCIEKFNADFVLVGEGEHSIHGLVEVIKGHAGPEEVQGLYWNDGGEVKHTEKGKPPADIDSLPFPAWDLFDMKSYTFPKRVPGVNGLVRSLGILTSRGCPYSCKFCFRLEKGYRLRSISNCIEEIKILLTKYKVNHLGFHDDLFIFDKKRTIEFCERILNKNLNFSWNCNGRFNLMDREQLRMMKKAGCVLVAYGLESGNQGILNEMDKKVKVEQIFEIAKITKEEGILVAVPSMFGLPGEDEKTINHTVDAIIATTSWHDKRTIRPMQPYPGSYYFDYCVQRGLLKDEEDFYSRYFSSEYITANLTKLTDSTFNKALYRANKRLLKAHYENAEKNDLEMFSEIYFKKNAKAFIPMR